MLRVIAAASLPSASSHLAPGRTPTSLRMVDSGTPVHSEVDVRPCVPCTVFSVGFDHSVKPLPEHSRNMMRDSDGKRRMSFIENFFACLTMPCTYSECLLGSMVAVPPWLRSKCKPGRCDDPAALFERRKRPRRFRGLGGKPCSYFRLELRPQPVAFIGQWRALHFARIGRDLTLDRA